jgi:hypothetical protein
MLTSEAQADTAKVLLANIDTIMRADTPYPAKIHIREIIRRDIVN